jgi:hypothetical protein
MTDPSTQREHHQRAAEGDAPAVGHDAGDPTGSGTDTNTNESWRDLSTPDTAEPPETAEAAEVRRDEPARNMIPARPQRRTAVERASMRLLATGGIVGLATILGAVLVSQDVAGWIVGLTVGLVSVLLAGILWSSRQL